MIKSTLYKNNRVKLTVIYHLNKVLSYSFKQLHTIYEHAYAFIHLIGHRTSLRKSTNILQKIINNYCNDLNLSTPRSITYLTHAFQGNIIADPFIGWKRQ